MANAKKFNDLQTKMKAKILKDLEKINFLNLFSSRSNVDLVKSGSILDIKSQDNKVTIIIDLIPLSLTRDEALLIKEIIIKNLSKPKFFSRKYQDVNVIFTSSSNSTKSAPIKEDKNNPSSAPNNQKSANYPIKNIKNIIAIASGKGGVGKSTVAVNLAISLNRVGFNVGLVDGDVYGPSIAHMMNLKDKPDFKDNLMIPIKSYKINCVSIGNIVDKDQALIWRGPMVTKTIDQLIRGVNWGYEDKDIDYLIVDLPPGTGDVHLTMAKQFPISGAVIVSTPGDVALIDVVKAIDMFQKLNVPIIGIVQNMAYLQDENGQKTYLFGKDKAKDLASKLNLNFLGDIKIDINIRESGDNKDPITNSNPSGDVAISYGMIAENIIDFFAK